jgi:hypothetical protein
MDPILQYELRNYRETVLGGVVKAERHNQEMYQQLDAQLRQSAALARGIDTIGWDTAAISSRLGRMVAVAESTLPAMAQYLAHSAEKLDHIAAMIANPHKTAGAELFLDGSHALASGWTDVAIRLLAAAVSDDKSPLHATAWFNLGVALIRQGTTPTQAADAFSNSARFAVNKSPDLSSTAVLLSAAAYRTARQNQMSAQVLLAHLAKLDLCAEIHLALAVHHSDDNEHLYRALTIAPELAADAIAHEVPHADLVAADACEHAQSPVLRLRQLGSTMRDVVTAARKVQLEHLSALPFMPSLPKPGVDALLRAHSALPLALIVAERLQSEVTTQLSRQAEEAQEADRQAEATRQQLRAYMEMVRNENSAHVDQTVLEGAQRIDHRRREGKVRVERILQDSDDELAALQRHVDETYARLTESARVELSDLIQRSNQLIAQEREAEFDLFRYAYSQIVATHVDRSGHVQALDGIDFFSSLRSYREQDRAYWNSVARNPIGSDGVIYETVDGHFKKEIQALSAQRADIEAQLLRMLEGYTEPLVKAAMRDEFLSHELDEASLISRCEQACLDEYARVKEATCSLLPADRYTPADYYRRPLEHDLLVTVQSQLEQLRSSAKSVVDRVTPKLEIARSQVAHELEKARRPAQQAVELAKKSAETTIPAAIRAIEQTANADIALIQQEATIARRRAEVEADASVEQADAVADRAYSAANATAQVKAAAFAQAKDTLAQPMEHLAEAVQVARAPRPRIVPFNVPGQMELTQQ